MVAWNKNLKPTEIQNVASYILSLQGTNPAGAKAAEGELWAEAATVPIEKVSDTTKVTIPLTK
jgi:cytochrome c oxidase cbb3-type subunit 3